MIICGIDPGKTGGIACLEDDTGAIVDLRPMMAMAELSEFLAERKPWLTVLEKAQTMPKQGIVSAFTYGEHFGMIQGFLIAHGLRHVLIAPREWTREMHRGCDAKEPAKAKSLTAVQRWFPRVNLLATERSKKPHEGLIDALLIADYGRKYLERRESPSGP